MARTIVKHLAPAPRAVGLEGSLAETEPVERDVPEAGVCRGDRYVDRETFENPAGGIARLGGRKVVWKARVVEQGDGEPDEIRGEEQRVAREEVRPPLR